VIGAELVRDGVQAIAWSALGPALAPAVAALVLLAVDAVVGPRRGGRWWRDGLALAGLVVGLLLVVALRGSATVTVCADATAASTAAPPPLGCGLGG
jgi:hypothetical protein